MSSQADLWVTDGIIYLPEIKYRRILNRAFGPGGWGLAPRGETNIGSKTISREYALVCLGRLVGIARGEQDYFDPSGIATATEGCKSNALMRCCKDLGIASELWSVPRNMPRNHPLADHPFTQGPTVHQELQGKALLRGLGRTHPYKEEVSDAFFLLWRNATTDSASCFLTFRAKRWRRKDDKLAYPYQET
jgi:hypothetical protein